MPDGKAASDKPSRYVIRDAIGAAAQDGQRASDFNAYTGVSYYARNARARAVGGGE
jgi:hypothetical protein